MSFQEDQFNHFRKTFLSHEVHETHKNNLMRNFLPDCANEIAEEWGVNENLADLFTQHYCRKNINGEVVICEFKTGKGPFFILTQEGNIYSASLTHEKTGNKIWNGDDVYYDEVKTDYVDVKLIEKMENTIRFDDSSEVSFSDIESAACELVSIAAKILG